MFSEEEYYLLLMSAYEEYASFFDLICVFELKNK